jgi:hypothetical protein
VSPAVYYLLLLLLLDERNIISRDGKEPEPVIKEPVIKELNPNPNFQGKQVIELNDCLMALLQLLKQTAWRGTGSGV